MVDTKILKDEIVGNEARKLFNDAQQILKKALNENWLDVRAVFGFGKLILMLMIYLF